MTAAVEILAIFALMFTGITIAALWFAHSSSKLKNRKELQQHKIDLIDNHFTEMLRIECPYCHTLYRPNEDECPNCGATSVKVLIPELPE